MNLLSELPDFVSLGGSLVNHFLLKSYKPTILVWSLTNKCNLNCSYCGLPGLKTNELEGDNLFNYLDIAAKNGLKLLSISGGEPLLHKNFHEFVERSRRYGILLSLNTNGVLVEKNLSFIKKNFFQVFLSLDGPPKINDKHRGEGSALAALRAIKLLKENGVKTNVTSVITKSIFNKLREVVVFGEDENIPIFFQPVFDKNLDFSFNSNSLNDEELLIALDTMLRLKKEKNKFILNSTKSIKFWKGLIGSEKTISCRTGKLFGRIEPNGDLVRCGRVKKGVPYGQVLEKGFLNSFLELQNYKDCSMCSSHIAVKTNLLNKRNENQ